MWLCTEKKKYYTCLRSPNCTVQLGTLENHWFLGWSLYFWRFCYTQRLHAMAILGGLRFSTNSTCATNMSWIQWESQQKHLVGGWATPLKNDGVRQLGWWHSIPNMMGKSEKHIKAMFQSPPTRHFFAVFKTARPVVPFDCLVVFHPGIPSGIIPNFEIGFSPEKLSTIIYHWAHVFDMCETPWNHCSTRNDNPIIVGTSIKPRYVIITKSMNDQM